MIKHAIKNDVIQINEHLDGNNAEMWIGCLMYVTDVYSWGVMAGMHVPGRGNTYLRINHGQYDVIGQAALVER